MNFVIVGIAGYIAPKHIRAIKEVGGNLIASIDLSDSVGILDKYFPNCKHFLKFERFDRFCSENKVDYVVVCSPNYLHFYHCTWAMRNHMNVICEKPLCLHEYQIDELLYMEEITGCRVWNIAQLRLGEMVYQLKEKNLSSVDFIELKYYTPRGSWYHTSWKGDTKLSGGLTTAIGIHLFDILLFLFGNNYIILDWHNTSEVCYGCLKIEKCMVDIELSIELKNEPRRELIIEDKEYELSKGFTDLHSLSYQNIIDGKGISIKDISQAVILCEKLRGY